MTFQRITAAITTAVAFAGLCLAQKPKSQKEVDALMAIQNAADAESRLAAIESLLTKFADTEFKVVVLEMATETARMKGDAEKTIIYGERVLAADANNIATMAVLAKLIAERTREFDLDKEDKLKQAEAYAKKVLELAPTAKKNNTMMSDEQWAERVKDASSQDRKSVV